MIVEISKGYQITIPANIRNELGLGVGSPLEVEKKNGKIIIKPIKEDLDEMFRKAKNIKPKKNMTVEEMEKLNERLFR
jgi:AbrB family looped-hinge helix DNA binding protein